CFLSLTTNLRTACTFSYYIYYAALTVYYPLSLHDALPISASINFVTPAAGPVAANNVTDTHILNHAFENLTAVPRTVNYSVEPRSEEHTSELQSRENLVCRLLQEK